MIIENFLTFTGKIGGVAAYVGTPDYLFKLAIVAVVVFLSVGLPLLFIVPMILSWRKNSYLLKNGEPAQAKILQIWDTGVTVNDNPQVRFRLEIYAPDSAIFQAEAKSIVSRLQIPQIQVGALVEVRYDPRDPSRVALVI